MILILKKGECLTGFKHPKLSLIISEDNIFVTDCAGKELIVFPNVKGCMIQFDGPLYFEGSHTSARKKKK